MKQLNLYRILFLGVFSLGLALKVSAQKSKTDSLQHLINNAIDGMYRTEVFSKSQIDLAVLEKEVVRKYGEVGQQVIWNAITLKYYNAYVNDKNDKDLDQWVGYKAKIQSKYPMITNDFDSNNDAWLLFENTSNQKHLKEGLKWSIKAVTLDPQNGNWKDTYSNLLYKLGRVKEAIAMEEKALLLDPHNSDIRTNLQKMWDGIKTWGD